jgi:hypothetical protein
MVYISNFSLHFKIPFQLNFPQISTSFCTYFESSFSPVRAVCSPVLLCARACPVSRATADASAAPDVVTPAPFRAPSAPSSRPRHRPASTSPDHPDTPHGEYFQPPPTRPPLPLCTSTILLQSTTHNSTVSSCCRPVPSTASLIFSLFFWFFGHF